MTGLAFRLLGPFAVLEDGRREIPPPAKKAQALLAYLAMHPDRPQSREVLASLLWGDRFDEQARQSLRQCLLALRKTLGDHSESVIIADGDTLAFADAEVDVHAFERLAASPDRDRLQEAAEIYRGDLLEGLSVRSDPFDQWLEQERTRLRDRAADVHGQLMTLHQSAGELDQAIESAKRVLALDPVREEAHRALMRLYDRSGRRSAALQQYETCRETLRSQIGVEPDAATQELRETIQSSSTKPNRRLAAILAADVVGYSRQMGRDEAGTLARMTSLRRELWEPSVAEHHGRIVKLIGDGILAEFASVVDAVGCAAAVQRDLAERHAGVASDKRIDYRIGINLGDILVEEDDIYGDGVNVAARLEQAAEPGGILISGAAFDQVKHKIDLDLEDLGERRLKNIADPIRLYRVVPGRSSIVAKGLGRMTSRRGRWTAAAAAACVLSVAVAVAAWMLLRAPDAGLPAKPSIAILPFKNLSGSPANEDLADALTEEITTALSMIAEMTVIAHRSALVYEDTTAGAPRIADELGVRYLLNGSVQRQGNQLRVAAQLVDSVKNGQIWGAIYDREVENIFAVQDAITLSIVTGLQVELTEGEQERISLIHGTDNITAWTLTGRGRRIILRLTAADMDRARSLYIRATEIDPDYPGPWEGLAWTHFLDAWFGWSESREQSFVLAHQMAQKTLALDSRRPRTYALLGSVSLMSGDFEQAVAHGERAVALSPSGSDVAALLGLTLTYTGEPERGVALIERAMRLSPYHADWYDWTLGRAYRQLGRYDDAIEALTRQQGDARRSMIPRVELVATLSEMGRDAEARAEARKILAAEPGFSARSWTEWPRHKDPAVTDREFQALLRAGLPE